MLNFLLFLMLNISPTTPPEQLFVASDSLFNRNGIITLAHRDGWRFHPGDDMKWANPDFDDNDWMFYKPSRLTKPIPDSLWNGYGWFRFRFAADSTIYYKVWNLDFTTWGAAEVYLDGKLVQPYGKFSANRKEEVRYMPILKTNAAVLLIPNKNHVLAVRFSYHKAADYQRLLGKNASGFGFQIGLCDSHQNNRITSMRESMARMLYVSGTMLLLIILLHGLLYYLFPVEKSNLYISVIAFLLFAHIVLGSSYLFFELDRLQSFLFRDMPVYIIFPIVLSLLPHTLNSMFNLKNKRIHKMMIVLYPAIVIILWIISDISNISFIIISLATLFFAISIFNQARKKGEKGIWFVVAGFLGMLLGALMTLVLNILQQFIEIPYEVYSLFVIVTYISIPLGMTLFMAHRFFVLFTGLEDKVHERTRELKKSLDDLNSTQSQLIHSEKLASLGALTAGIAHEIQNPLNFVNNFSEVNTELIDEMDEEIDNGNLEEIKAIAKDIKENEQKINHHGKRAESIVKGMLLHSRGNSGHKEPTDINALCDEYLRLSYHGFRAKDKAFNADFKLETDPSLPKIEVVPQDIGRVLLNLINNAFYAVSSASVGVVSKVINTQNSL